MNLRLIMELKKKVDLNNFTFFMIDELYRKMIKSMLYLNPSQRLTVFNILKELIHNNLLFVNQEDIEFLFSLNFKALYENKLNKQQ